MKASTSISRSDRSSLDAGRRKTGRSANGVALPSPLRCGVAGNPQRKAIRPCTKSPPPRRRLCMTAVARSGRAISACASESIRDESVTPNGHHVDHPGNLSIRMQFRIRPKAAYSYEDRVLMLHQTVIRKSRASASNAQFCELLWRFDDAFGSSQNIRVV